MNLNVCSLCSKEYVDSSSAVTWENDVLYKAVQNIINYETKDKDKIIEELTQRIANLMSENDKMMARIQEDRQRIVEIKSMANERISNLEQHIFNLKHGE